MKYDFADLLELSPQEFREVIDTIRPRVYTWRYVWKVKGEDSLRVKYVCDVKKAHEDFRKCLRENEDVVSCIAEYIGEVDPVLMAYSDVIKKEVEVEIEKED